jgi:hypothetical protein
MAASKNRIVTTRAVYSWTTIGAFPSGPKPSDNSALPRQLRFYDLTSQGGRSTSQDATGEKGLWYPRGRARLLEIAGAQT